MVNIYNQDLIDTDTHKSRYYWTGDYCSIQTMVICYNIETSYNMLVYKVKVVHVECDT